MIFQIIDLDERTLFRVDLNSATTYFVTILVY